MHNNLSIPLQAEITGASDEASLSTSVGDALQLYYIKFLLYIKQRWIGIFCLSPELFISIFIFIPVISIKY